MPYHVFKIDRSGTPSWLSAEEDLERAVAEATRRHLAEPDFEYRVINANSGVVECLSPVERD